MQLELRSFRPAEKKKNNNDEQTLFSAGLESTDLAISERSTLFGEATSAEKSCDARTTGSGGTIELV